MSPIRKVISTLNPPAQAGQALKGTFATSSLLSTPPLEPVPPAREGRGVKQISKFLVIFLVLPAFIACKKQTTSLQTDLSTPVSVMDIKSGTIETFINATGTVMATHETTLLSEMAGKYFPAVNPATGKPYKLGDQVKKGEVLIRIEDEEYENNIAIDARKLNLEISEQEFKKQETLYDKGGVTLRELRNSEVSYINSRYDYESAMLRLAKMKISSPFDGVIVDLPYYTPGTKINSGSAMVTLMAYKKMYMEINLPEKNLQEIKAGQDIYITSYVFPQDTLKGRVAEISPAISKETRTFKCKLEIDNPALILRPGMFVKADIITLHKSDVILIPKEYVLSDARGKRVFTVQQQTARESRITTGLENETMVEVVNGLEIDQKLVIKGFETLRDRAKVNVIQ
jgi:membrane fusion protein, multidrug efflux system